MHKIVFMTCVALSIFSLKAATVAINDKGDIVGPPSPRSCESWPSRRPRVMPEMDNHPAVLLLLDNQDDIVIQDTVLEQPEQKETRTCPHPVSIMCRPISALARCTGSVVYKLTKCCWK